MFTDSILARKGYYESQQGWSRSQWKKWLGLPGNICLVAVTEEDQRRYDNLSFLHKKKLYVNPPSRIVVISTYDYMRNQDQWQERDCKMRDLEILKKAALHLRLHNQEENPLQYLDRKLRELNARLVRLRTWQSQSIASYTFLHRWDFEEITNDSDNESDDDGADENPPKRKKR